MGRKALAAIVVIQFVVIGALGVLLLHGRRPTAEQEKAETALADIRGVLSVGANYTQLQEKVQALAAAIENFRGRGGPESELARLERSQKFYKDSLDLWSEELSYPGLYGRAPHGRYVPTVLRHIAKEQGFDLSDPEFSYKIFADDLLRQLWTKGESDARGVNTQHEPAPESAWSKQR